jgi:NAD(P)-dependent dehydrogenase (short-subunit alcohol dehydrogenase family)
MVRQEQARRVAVVAGGGRGIGGAIALALAEDGVHVHVVARTAEQLHQVVAEIRSSGGSACAVPLNVARAQLQGGRELVYALPGIGVSRHSGNGEHAAPGRSAERDVAANWR